MNKPSIAFTTLVLTTLISLSALAQDAVPTAAALPSAPMEADASALPAASAPASSAVAAPASFSAAVTEAIGAPPEGKGHIVFFRPNKFVGGAIGYKVREATAELGKLKNGSFFVLDVEPGAHTYTVHSENKDMTNIEVEAGETYFLIGTVTMGVFAGRPNLSPSDVTAFEALLPKLKKTQAL